METVAIYWERPIRTYGVEVRRGLTLVTLGVAGAQVEARLADLLEEEPLGDFLVSAAQREGSGALHLQLLSDRDEDAIVAWRDATIPALGGGEEVSFHLETPVAALCFHGPHYGDRYGIATAAFRSLQRRGVEVLLASCTGASIIIAVEEAQAEEALSGLGEEFVVPGALIGASS